MRPRTATIQVYQSKTIAKELSQSIKDMSPDETLWVVEIGNPGASTPMGVFAEESLDAALINAVLAWKEVEGLGD